MAILGSLSIGRSGLISSSAAMSVIGNNIANAQTIGFKGSRTEFADLLAAEGGGQAGKVGLGARIGQVRGLFTQGAIEATGRNLDLGIQGGGFFVLRDGALGRVFSRAGAFQLQADGSISNGSGQVLQGTPINANGTTGGAVQDVTAGGVNSQAQATDALTVVGNLQSDAQLLGTPPGTFDPTSFQTAFSTSNFPTTMQVFDSLGSAHSLHLFFTRTGANTWDLHMGVDAGETGGTPGNLQIVNGAGGAQLAFNTDGTFAGVTSGSLIANMTFSGAAAQAVTFDPGTTGQSDGLSQFASPSGFASQTQNGFAAGEPVSIGVDDLGILSATFDNGQVRPLFQLAIAKFISPEGLSPAGDAVYHETLESGQPTIGAAGSQGNGTVVAAALEQSNVQLAQEFIDLISTQRSFQANARVITASDGILNDLVNIVR